MNKIIRLNKDNYMIDKITNEIIKKYDPSNENLILVLKLEDGSTLNVEASQIHELYSGSIYFDYTDINGTDRYFIDDDYQDWMIRCGYIVLDDYDIKKITDKNEGIKIRNELTSKIKEISSLYDFWRIEFNSDSFDVSYPGMSQTKIQFQKEGYEFSVYFNTINNIVSKNQQRRMNGLPFFPFNKNMDKYGTIYISIFCRKISDIDFNFRRYNIADDFIRKFIKKLTDEYSYSIIEDDNHQFHYVPLIIKKKIGSKS